ACERDRVGVQSDLAAETELLEDEANRGLVAELGVLSKELGGRRPFAALPRRDQRLDVLLNCEHVGALERGATIVCERRRRAGFGFSGALCPAFHHEILKELSGLDGADRWPTDAPARRESGARCLRAVRSGWQSRRAAGPGA